MAPRYSARHKMLVLYLSPENQIWTRLRDLLKETLTKDKKDKGGIRWATTPLTASHIAELSGIAQTTIENWRHLGPIREDAVDRALNAVSLWSKRWTGSSNEQDSEMRALLDIETSFRRIYEENKYVIYDIATVLQMDQDTCKHVCDTVVYDERPLLPNAYYAENSLLGSDGEKHRQQYAGVYILWAKRGEVWLKAPLHVRYLTQVKKSAFFLRCKLNFPIISDRQARAHESAAEPGRRAPSYWEYDGYVVVRDHRLYFNFEKRDSDRSDYFTFITGRKSLDDKNLVLRGKYLTTGQDKYQSVVAGDILMRRCLRNSKDEAQRDIRDLMWKSDMVLEQGSDGFTEIESLWERYRGSSDYDEVS